MQKCKRKDCQNKTVEGKKYCKYHIALKEDKFKKITAALASVAGIGLGLMTKVFKDYIKK